MNFTLLFPNFKKRAVTFSFDDGVVQDKELTEIFRKHGMRGTFNLNSLKSGAIKKRIDKDGVEIDCSHLYLTGNRDVYRGMEVACHTANHPHLEELGYEEQLVEYNEDIENLRGIYGKNVVGGAYPYGTYNAMTLEVLRKLGLHYMRTTRSTYAFHRPFNWLLWNPTIHHRDPRLKETVDRFLKCNDELPILYIWGHAYEFAIDHNFDLMDELCARLEKEEDLYKGTNEEIYGYCKAAELVYSRDGAFINPSDKDVYLLGEDGKQYCVKAKERLVYDDGK